MRRILSCFVLLTLISILDHPTPSTAANNSENLTVRAYQPTGICETISGADGILVIGKGASIDFYDVSTPASPVLLGSTLAQARVVRVKYLGDTTIMVAGDFWANRYTVNIIDSSDPGNATILGSLNLSSTVHAIARSGSTLYLSLPYSTVIVDISTPSSPAQIGSFESSMSSEARDNRLYLGTAGGALRIMDITTPSAPVEIGSIDYDSSIYGLAISADGQTAYLGRYGLQIVDISTPDTPLHVGEFSPYEYFFISDVAVTDAGVYCLADGGFYLVDPTDPTDPVQLGYLDSDHFVEEISVDTDFPDFCFAAMGPGALAIDFSIPATPAGVASLHTGYYVKELVVQDIATEAGKRPPVTEVKISAAMALGGLGFFRYSGIGEDPIEVEEPLLVELTGLRVEGLGIVKFGSTTASPVAVGTKTDVKIASGLTGVEPLLSTIDLFGWGKSLSYADDKIAVSSSSFRNIDFIDVSDLENPVIEHTEYVGEYVVDLDWREGHSVLSIVTGSSPEQVRLYNTIVAITPVLISAFSPGSNIVAVDVLDDFMYVADYQNNIYVYDITDGANPVALGTFDLASFAQTTAILAAHPTSSLKAGETYLYVTAMEKGLYVLDVTDPEAISQLAWFDTADEASTVAVHNDLIYVGDGFAGIYVLELTPDTPVMFGSFDAQVRGDRAILSWELSAGDTIRGLRIYREDMESPLPRILPGDGILPPTSTSYEDDSVEPGSDYIYTLSAVTSSGDVNSGSIAVHIPATDMGIHGSHPNPFNPSTTITYSLPEPGDVTLSVYDLYGRLIRTLVDADLSAGRKTAEWNGTDATGRRVASGTYFLRLETNQGVRTGKVMLAK